jgi:hypothetical protein
MAGLDPAIQAYSSTRSLDARIKSAHDGAAKMRHTFGSTL